MNLTQWWNNNVHIVTWKATGPTVEGGGNTFSGLMPDQDAIELAVNIFARPGRELLAVSQPLALHVDLVLGVTLGDWEPIIWSWCD